MNTRTIPFALALVLALAGCGGGAAAVRPDVPRAPAPIDAIRARAAANPDDPDAQRALAEWELLGEGGDPARAEAAIARAAELAPNEIALAYLRGVLAEQRGQPDAALDAFVAVLAGAPSSADPLAPFYVESAIAFVNDLATNAERPAERARPAMEALFASPGRLGTSARRRAMYWLEDKALRRGDMAEAARLERALACPTEARVAGPFGPNVLSPFDATLPAEGRGPLAARYDLGPGRGETETASITARFCALPLGEGEQGPGTRIVEASLSVETAGRYVLAVGTSGSIQASVDGVVVGRVDRRRRTGEPVAYFPVELSAGEHELELKLASRVSSPQLSFTLDRATDGYDPTVGLVVPADLESPLALFVGVDVLVLRHELVAARERLRGRLSETSSAAMLVLGARVAAADPFVPNTQREDDERRLVTWAAARDPSAHGPALRLAELETGELEALAMLREVAARFPQLASIGLELAGALAEAGYEADADAALARAAAARPEACAVVAARFDAEIDRGRVPKAAELAPALVACDARNEVRYELAMARHDWAAAREEIARLEPLLTPARRRALLLGVARASGDAAAETRLVAEIEREGEPGENVVPAADRRYAANDRAGALALVRAEAAREPRGASDLRRIELALAGEDVMQPFRVDGLEVIRRFEASGRSYEGQAAVLVFDYMVVRVFEDGSAIRLVHQIHRLQTNEGVERYGELRLGGRALTVRAVGRDGRLREPDEIGARIDMPPLEIGDYVEYEYVSDVAPEWGDGYLSGGWVFQSFSQPFDHSEIVFVVPRGLDLHIVPRGPVPPPETREEGGLRVHRYLMTEQRALAREPNALDEPPILPGLRAGARVTWDRMFDAVRDRLLDVDPEDPAAVRLLRTEILGGAELAPRARVQRIHRWVVENVEDGGDFFGSAPLMLAARQGQRARVLRYLLELAGVPAKIAFARSIAGERPDPNVPDADVYGQVLVVAEPGGAPLYLTTAMRGASHALLLPAVRSQEAIVITDGLPRVVLPSDQGPLTGLRVDGDVQVEGDGRASLRLRVAFTGGAGAEMREAIRQIPPAERGRLIAERFAPSIVPGAVADPASISFRGLDDWESDFEIELAMASSGLVRRGPDGLYLVPLFPASLDARFAQLPTRTTTQLVGETDVAVTLRIHGPRVVRAPSSRSLAGPGGAVAALEVGREADGSLRIARRVRVPLAAIPVSEYPTFAAFCRAAGELENAPIVLAPR